MNTVYAVEETLCGAIDYIEYKHNILEKLING